MCHMNEQGDKLVSRPVIEQPRVGEQSCVTLRSYLDSKNSKSMVLTSTHPKA